MAIGSLYNSRGVVVGQAAGFYAPADTPLPPDTTSVFDETTWLGTVVGVGAATAGTFTLSLAGGPFAAPVTTAGIPYNAAASAVAAAVQAVLPAGYTAVVTGTAPSFMVSIVGPASAEIDVTGSGTGLTGGSGFLVTDSVWTAAGATEQGWAVNYTPNVQDINIEEQPTPVQQQVNTATLQFVANLAEDTVASLKLGLSATSQVQAADSTHYGKTTLTLQESLPTLAVAVETKNMFGYPRRYYVPRATCAANVGQTFRRAAAMRMVPVTITSICNLDEIQVVEITAPPTS